MSTGAAKVEGKPGLEKTLTQNAEEQDGRVLDVTGRHADRILNERQSGNLPEVQLNNIAEDKSSLSEKFQAAKTRLEETLKEISSPTEDTRESRRAVFRAQHALYKEFIESSDSSVVEEMAASDPIFRKHFNIYDRAQQFRSITFEKYKAASQQKRQLAQAPVTNPQGTPNKNPDSDTSLGKTNDQDKKDKKDKASLKASILTAEQRKSLEQQAERVVESIYKEGITQDNAERIMKQLANLQKDLGKLSESEQKIIAGALGIISGDPREIVEAQMKKPTTGIEIPAQLNKLMRKLGDESERYQLAEVAKVTAADLVKFFQNQGIEENQIEEKINTLAKLPEALKDKGNGILLWLLKMAGVMAFSTTIGAGSKAMSGTQR